MSYLGVYICGIFSNCMCLMEFFSNNVCVLVGNEGVIKGWTEEQLNMSRAVHYNPQTGTFKVERSGVYFLYCQVS